MGLSDNERIEKSIWAANRITSLALKLNSGSTDFSKWETRDRVDRLKLLCLDIIPEMSARSGNSAYWLLGSDSEVSRVKTTLFSIALYDKIRYTMTPEADAAIEEKKKGLPDMWGKEIRKEERKYFEVDGYLTDQGSTVYQIFQWCESFQYASNRYDDDLSSKYYRVNSVVSHIMNECFNVFNNEPQFAEAYLKSILFPKLLGTNQYGKYESWDELTRFIIKNHLQYSFVNYGNSEHVPFLLDQLKKWNVELDKKSDMRSRFNIWIRLIANNFDSDHSKKPLIDLCKKLKIDYSKKVKPILDRAAKEKKAETDLRSRLDKEDSKQDYVDLMERETSPFHFEWNSD